MGDQFSAYLLHINFNQKKREDDPVNWARKRKPDWMATTGKIHFTRERTVDKELEEENGSKEPSPTPEQVPEKEVVKMPPTEIPIMTNMERKQANDYWPRKMRSDITRSRVI